MPREILVDWTTASGGGKVSVFNFIELSPVADQRSALNDFLTSCNDTLGASTSWTIRTEGKEMNAATGTLEGSWNEAIPYTGGGPVGNTAILADATQVLVRWNTDRIHNGRYLRGRTYIPGIFRSVSEAGNVYIASQTAISAGAAALTSAGVQFGIWSRPKPGVPGVMANATGGVCWSEFAVQRRRRS